MRKFKIAIAAALLGGCLGAARAQMIPGESAVPLGFCQLASISSAQPLSTCNAGAGIPAGANAVAMQATVAAVAYRDDGTAPTSTIGMQLLTTAPPMWYSGTLAKLQFISATGAVNVSFYRVVN